MSQDAIIVSIAKSIVAELKHLPKGQWDTDGVALVALILNNSTPKIQMQIEWLKHNHQKEIAELRKGKEK